MVISQFTFQEIYQFVTVAILVFFEGFDISQNNEAVNNTPSYSSQSVFEKYIIVYIQYLHLVRSTECIVWKSFD